MLTQLSPRERLLYFLAVVGCLGVFGFVGAQYLKRPPDIVLKPLEEAVDRKQTPHSEVVVHVVGAVRKPGLLKLSGDSRVNDAVQRAGGSTSNADLESINLAARLIDGSQVKVPRKGTSDAETIVDAYKGGGSEVYDTHRTSSSASSRSSGSPGAGSVSLNSASQAQFESLPQIGPATARKILEYRKSTGGFSSVEELLKVNGIGPKKLAAIRKYVRL
jgi:competence protein ComEA